MRSALLLRAGGDREERRYLRLCAAWNFTGIRGAVRGEGCAFIDLGADFRLKEESDYAQWYGGAYTHQELHSQAVYALPELFRAEIQKARILANPAVTPPAWHWGLRRLCGKGSSSREGIVSIRNPA